MKLGKFLTSSLAPSLRLAIYSLSSISLLGASWLIQSGHKSNPTSGISENGAIFRPKCPTTTILLKCYLPPDGAYMTFWIH